MFVSVGFLVETHTVGQVCRILATQDCLARDGKCDAHVALSILRPSKYFRIPALSISALRKRYFNTGWISLA